jgi:ubiquinone/menaquinone biosynthesis C-methylase UbiE
MVFSGLKDSDLYDDPALYDLLFPAGKAIACEQFYLSEAIEGGGRALELGCGTGRLSVLLAQNGIGVVGADLSTSMLEAAWAKAVAAGIDVQFVQADMRHFDLA